jgi:alpha-1,2-mannosyltransferase
MGILEFEARVTAVRRLRFLAWTLFVVRVAVLDPWEILRAHSLSDYTSFHFAAVALAHGEDPYSSALSHYAAVEGLAAHPYIYPPFLGWLLAPLTPLGAWHARLVWEAFAIVAALGVLWLIHRWIDESRTEHAEASKTAVTFIAACFWPLRGSAWMGQVNMIIFCLIMLWWVFRARSPRAGIWLGVAIAIKMSPALLVLWVLAQKRWREAGIVVGSAALLVAISCLAMGKNWAVFPTSVLAGFLPGHAYHSFTIPIHHFGNESLADLAYVLTGNPGGNAFRLGTAASAVQISCVAVMLVVWAVASRRARPEHSLAALTIIMILAPTYAWEHHLAFSLFALAVLADTSLTCGWKKATAIWILIALVCEPDNSFALPPWEWPPLVGDLAALPKLLPLLGVFSLLVRDGFRAKDLAPARAISDRAKGDLVAVSESQGA